MQTPGVPPTTPANIQISWPAVKSAREFPSCTVLISHFLLFKGIFDFPVCLIFLFQGCRRLVGPDVASKERSFFGLLYQI